MYPGSSRLTCWPDSICWRCRSISAGANAGWRAMSDSIRSPASKLSFITTMFDEGQIGAGAGAHRAADEVDGVVHLLRRHRSSCPDRAATPPGARARASASDRTRVPAAHQQPHRHRRLLVVQHDDDLQAVGQRLDLVGRELDVARRQRLRRALGRPAADCARGAGTEDETHEHSTPGRHATDADTDRMVAHCGTPPCPTASA